MPSARRGSIDGDMVHAAAASGKNIAAAIDDARHKRSEPAVVKAEEKPAISPDSKPDKPAPLPKN